MERTPARRPAMRYFRHEERPLARSYQIRGSEKRTPQRGQRKAGNSPLERGEPPRFSRIEIGGGGSMKPRRIRNRSKGRRFSGSTMQIALRIASGRPRPQRRERWSLHRAPMEGLE